MKIPEPVQFKGVPGSPYTRKMLAYLRYRHIRYELLLGDQATNAGLPDPKVNLLPTFYLPNEDGEIEAVVDSTPLIRRFEDAFEGRSAIPDNPVLAFINYLIEDYADEWLTKAMFHYRCAGHGPRTGLEEKASVAVIPDCSGHCPRLVSSPRGTYV